MFRTIKIVISVVAVFIMLLAGAHMAFAAKMTHLGSLGCAGTKLVDTYQYAPKDPTMQIVKATTLDCRSDAPWILLIHGGSWINGDISSMDPATDVFYNNGWNVFNMDYRRGDHVNWLMQQRDLEAAYGWISDHAGQFNLDMARGSMYGFSAGGHMAAWLNNQGHSFSSVITVSGVLQPQRVAADDNGARPQSEPTTPEMHNLHLREVDMMGCDWTPDTGMTADCQAAWDNFIPENTINANSAPMYMLQGDQDPLVPHPTPDAYGWHLGQAGIDSQVLHDPDWGHTQHLFLYNPDRQATILQWMMNKWPQTLSRVRTCK